MDEYQAEVLAAKVAAHPDYRPSYYTEPFKPHGWVIAAILEAYEQGKSDGYKRGYHIGTEAGYECGFDDGYEEAKYGDW